MAEENRFGLGRYIPPEIRRLLRKEAGYGCVICGNIIIEYEHIEPEFKDALEHDPNKMTILCPGCHANVTKELIAKSTVWEAKRNPIVKNQGSATHKLFVGNAKVLKIKIGDTIFSNAKSIIEIDDKVILQILPPEAKEAPFRINASFFDSNNEFVAAIINNELNVFSTILDFENKKNRFSIWNENEEKLLELTVLAPNTISVEEINLRYNGVSVLGNTSDGFRVDNGRESMELPKGETLISQANYGIFVKGGVINLGMDNVVRYNKRDETSKLLPGSYSIHKGNLGFVTKEDGSQMIEFKSDGPDSYMTIGMDSISEEVSPKVQFPNYEGKCKCGSGRFYDNCCKASFDKIVKILNDPRIMRMFNKEKLNRYNFKFTIEPGLTRPYRVSYNAELNEVQLRIKEKEVISIGLVARTISFALVAEIFYNIQKIFKSGTAFDQIALWLIDLIAEIFSTNIPRRYNIDLEQYGRLNLNIILKDLKELEQFAPNDHVLVLLAICYINFNYMCFFLPENEKESILNKFDTLPDKSKMVALDLIGIINHNDPYSVENFLNTYISVLSFEKFNECYEDYIKAIKQFDISHI
ncbi:hypothetical protein MASR2M39_07690 [Ignavibacteriales bacterium]